MPFDARSERNLLGVRPDLIRFARDVCAWYDARMPGWAVQCTDGVRTPEQQRQHVEAGTSWTMQSKHLRQPDGFGHAVDLVVFLDGRPRWEEAAYIRLALVARTVSQSLGLEITWGGVFDRQMGDLSEDIRFEIDAYRRRRARQGKGPIFDGPHFEVAA